MTSPFALLAATERATSWMSYSFRASVGVTIHSSPSVGAQLRCAAGNDSISTLEKPYSFAKPAITSLSRKWPWYSDTGRMCGYDASSSTWCIARSPEASLMMARICS